METAFKERDRKLSWRASHGISGSDGQVEVAVMVKGEKASHPRDASTRTSCQIRSWSSIVELFILPRTR